MFPNRICRLSGRPADGIGHEREMTNCRSVRRAAVRRTIRIADGRAGQATCCGSGAPRRARGTSPGHYGFTELGSASWQLRRSAWRGLSVRWRGRSARCAGADDQFGLQNDGGVTVLVARSYFVHQQPDRFLPHHPARHVHRGQRHRRGAGRAVVLTADDRDPVGHADPCHGMELMDNGVGQFIGDRDQAVRQIAGARRARSCPTTCPWDVVRPPLSISSRLTPPPASSTAARTPCACRARAGSRRAPPHRPVVSARCRGDGGLPDIRRAHC